MEDAIYRGGTNNRQKKKHYMLSSLPPVIFGAIIKYLHNIQASMISIIYLLFF